MSPSIRAAGRLAKPDWASFVRFLAVGAANTAVTYAIYLGLLGVMSYRWSYSFSYLIGIGIAYELNRRFVFKTEHDLVAAGAMPLIYLVQYVIGLGVVHVWVEWLGQAQSLAPLIAVLLLVPLTFLMTRLAFRRTARTPDANVDGN